MSDPKDIFNVNSDPFGPYQRQEERYEDVAGSKIPIREVYAEITGPDGVRQICVQRQYLCQKCGKEFVTIGQNGSITDGIIMCERCGSLAKWRYWTKPLWGFLIKTDGK